MRPAPDNGSKLNRAVVFGGSGLVGSRVLEQWRGELEVVAPTHADLDLLDGDAVAAFLAHTDAQVVLNFAAGAQVDAAEAERGDRAGLVYVLNAEYPERLAVLCRDLELHLVHVSTDYVFDGTQEARPYREDDPPNPLSWYGETKLIGEQRVRERHLGACIARIEMPFSAQPQPRGDFARTCQRRLEQGETIAGVTDQRITPVLLDDAARALQVLATSGWAGVVHVAATDWTTPYQYARSIAERLGLNRDLVEPTTFEAFGRTRAASRPQHSWLDTTRFTTLFGTEILRSFEDELDDWVGQRKQNLASQARA